MNKIDRTYQILVILSVINFCFLGYGLYDYIHQLNYPDNIPAEMVYNELEISLKSINKEIPYYEGGLMQIQDGDNIIKFPTKWYKGLSDLRIINCSDELVGVDIKFCNKNKSAMGTYFIKEKIIIMKTNLVESNFNLTVIHEIAHHIWYTQLNESIKIDWCNNYDRQIDYITGYAYSECEEDFAEAFRAYYLEGKVMEHEEDLIESIGGVLFTTN